MLPQNFDMVSHQCRDISLYVTRLVCREGRHDRGKCCHDREVVSRQSFLCRDKLEAVVKKKRKKKDPRDLEHHKMNL